MLNSEELEELRLLTPHEKVQAFPNIAQIVSSSSNIKLMGGDANANIRSFYYILLTQIFGHLEADLDNEDKKGEQLADSQYKLYRIKHLLYTPEIDLSQITNIPHQIERVLRNNQQQFSSNDEQCTGESEISKYKNIYLKKMIIEFLTLLWRQCGKVSQDSQDHSPSRTRLAQKELIFKVLKEYGISDALLCIFLRQTLLKEYDIALAADYSHSIPDHTVYTALCDAFGYDGLRLEDNECYISNDSVIHTLPVHKFNEERVNFWGDHEANIQKYYLVCFPQESSGSNQNNLHVNENIQFQTFRNRRKASRDLKAAENSQVSSGDNSFARKQSGGLRSEDQSLEIKERKEGLLWSQFVQGEGGSSGKLEKELKHERNNTQHHGIDYKTPREIGIHKASFPAEGCDYSSLEVIMQLSPNIRDTMLSSPKYKQLNIGETKND